MAFDKIIFVGDGRDFHAMDWYRTIKKICSTRQVFYATDLIDSEGRRKILEDEDSLIKLFNIDWLLFPNQSSAGNIWRNLIKVLVFPLQVISLRKIAKANPESIFHAHTMYYMFICWLAGIKYIGSPQGDEILIRPYRSSLYRFFAIKSLLAADHIIIDSTNLQNGIMELCGKTSSVIQYGIDVTAIMKHAGTAKERNKIISIRALYPLYRIDEIFRARDRSKNKPPLTFFYPFWEDGYKERMLKQLKTGDTDHGRIPLKTDMYKILASALLVISIPESDSSPRSVYESIFCGCCVAVAYNPWIESLPDCMRSRIYIIELEEDLWLDSAITYATKITQKPYIPSDAALNMFDQERSMKIVAEKFY
jgi:hypothetical protein